MSGKGKVPVELLVVGRLKGDFKFLEAGIQEYRKRLAPFASVDITEVADETLTATRTTQQVMEKEADRLLPRMEKGSFVLALSERGHLMDSETLAQELSKRCPYLNPLNGGIPHQGSKPMILVVGGPLGLSSRVLDKADWVLSLSPLTFPHPLVRLIILEQLYRTFKILRNEPYHK